MSSSRLSFALGVTLTALLAVGAASVEAQVEPYTPTGPITVDSGFVPDRHGFGFPNYGYEPYVKEMTPASMVEMFGRVVCVGRRVAPKCVLKPNAEKWMVAQNVTMAGGHCYGFSVSALRFFTGGLDPLRFGAPSVPELTLRRNRPLQELLARTWAHQLLPGVQRRVFWGTPKEVLARLEKALANPAKETWTIAVFNKFGGHAFTPYAVEDAGEGKRRVLVYDNNWPGITRAVRFDTRRNTYTYVGGEKPDEPLLTYPAAPGARRRARTSWASTRPHPGSAASPAGSAVGPQRPDRPAPRRAPATSTRST